MRVRVQGVTLTLLSRADLILLDLICAGRPVLGRNMGQQFDRREWQSGAWLLMELQALPRTRHMHW